jgi:hypothetical protein
VRYRRPRPRIADATFGDYLIPVNADVLTKLDLDNRVQSASPAPDAGLVDDRDGDV